MTLPNFLLVGAAKSGTTSLFNHLGQHPQVYVPVNKEPCYFSSGYPIFVRSDDEYEELFSSKVAEDAIGEASTTYLYDSEAPTRIRKLLGNIKIIMILRNPVHRAYSAWGHNFYQTGYESLSFEDALREEKTRMASKEFRERCPFYCGNYHYFHQGLYHGQVKRYFDMFGRERTQVHIFEEFIKDPAETCRKTFQFLGIDPSFRPVFEEHNIAPGFRIGFVHRFLVTPPALLKKAYRALPVKWRVLAYSMGKRVYWLNQRHTPRPPLDDKLRDVLTKKYLEDIKKLEKLLGRDLSIWYENYG